MNSTTKAFAPADGTLTRRSLIASVGLAAFPAVPGGSVSTPAPLRPCPPDVAELAREWLALVDRGIRLDAEGGSEADAEALYDAAEGIGHGDDGKPFYARGTGLHERLIDAMREHGITGILIGNRLLIDTYAGYGLPGVDDQFSAGLFDADAFRVL